MKPKKILCWAITAALTFSMTGNVFAAGINEVSVKKEVKNVILLIPDGMSTDGLTLARWYNGGAVLNLDGMASGLIRTYSSDAPIADSAPAGTAMATGFKSHTGFVGVLPDENTMPGMTPLNVDEKRMPVANILEAARLDGKATGIVATSEIMHATPADFSSHDPSRKNYDALSEQQVYQGMNVVIGGGTKYFTSDVRGDKEDLISVIKKNYQYADTPDQFNKVTKGNLWAMFAPAALSYDFDRDPKKEPSLAEMTDKAIDLLSQDKDGFFLMVEGSKVDWAAHANDPVGIVSDILAYDKAVGVALNFAKADGNTLVISAADHGNSGISIGSKATDGSYDKTPLAAFLDPLKKASLTGEGIGNRLNADRSNIAEVMKTYYGISDLTAEEIKAIKDTTSEMNYTVGPMIAKRADIGFTTTGHTGEDVTLYVYAPKGIDQLTGTVENTDIAAYMEKAMGLDLSKATEKLFVNAKEAFEAKGASVEFDDKTDPKNPVLITKKGNKVIKLPVNKNIAYVNDVPTTLNGVVVYNGINVYVPQSAVDLIK